MPDPDVTVLMPVRNGARFLDSAIASILGQTLDNYELLICDDGSTDATPRLLAGHARRDARIRVETLPRVGLVAALNHGMRQSRAAWVARMDADDVACPDRLRLQMDAAAWYPDAAAIGGAWRVVDANGRARRVVRPPCEPDAIAVALLQHNCLAHPTMLLRRDAVLQEGGYRAAFQQAEDYDLWLRLAEQHPLHALPETLLDYREHAGQATWAGLEQRILSELGARAAARARRAGLPDPTGDAARVDRAWLRTAGVTEQEIAAAMIAGALGAAKDALAAGQGAAARAAVGLLRRQRRLRPRTRAHALLLQARSLLSQSR